MDTIGIAVVLLAVAVGLLYAMSFGLVVLFEHLQRSYRQRRALIPLTRRLHELLAEAGHPPVVRHSGGRHRRHHPTGRRHRSAPVERDDHDETITGELPAYQASYEPEYPTEDPDLQEYEATQPATDRWSY